MVSIHPHLAAGKMIRNLRAGRRLPRPARYERGEGRGEGHLSQAGPAAHLLSPALSSIPWRRGSKIQKQWQGAPNRALRRSSGILFLISLLFLIFLTAAGSQAAGYDARFDQWFAVQTNLQSWAADFTQTRTLTVLAQPLVTPGKVWVKPGEFRWEIGQPDAVGRHLDRAVADPAREPENLGKIVADGPTGPSRAALKRFSDPDPGHPAKCSAGRSCR